MALYQFRLPDIGEGTAEAECVQWHVAVGDVVEEDQLLLEVMTDKATVEVTSPVDGTVVTRAGEVGVMLPVGSVVLEFDVAAGEDADDPKPAIAPDAASAQSPQSDIAVDEISRSQRVLATPAVRRRAREAGIELHTVKGSGPAGRVRQADLEAHAAQRANPASAPRPAASADAPSLAIASSRSSSLTPGDEEFDEAPVVGLRRKIAMRMQDTKRRIPHFSYIEEIDVTQLESLRAGFNAEFAGRRPKLTLLPFLIRALAVALPEFPHLNARYDDEADIVRHYRPLHAGIATQTPKGLVVTVLRNADGMDLWTLAGEVARLSDLARSGRASPADLSGSTITLSSLGPMGGVATTPVINSPEVAILGVNKVLERPIVDNGRIVIAKMMNLSGSFDHRVVDGWDAALFIQRIKGLLQNPGRLLID